MPVEQNYKISLQHLILSRHIYQRHLMRFLFKISHVNNLTQ